MKIRIPCWGKRMREWGVSQCRSAAQRSRPDRFKRGFTDRPASPPQPAEAEPLVRLGGDGALELGGELAQGFVDAGRALGGGWDVDRRTDLRAGGAGALAANAKHAPRAPPRR